MKKLLSEYPELLSEWHPTKNGDLCPEQFTFGSNKKVWWVCPKGHDYDVEIKSRTRKDKSRGCPYCSGQKIGEDNNLKHLFPKIAAEWHPTKNGDSRPEDFTSGSSHKKVWWLCPKGHSYDALIYSRTSNNSGCPYCSGKRVGKDNNLKCLFPKVASEWHPTKNGDSRPEDFTSGTKSKVWWLCPKGHSYDLMITSRTSKQLQGCPYCSGKRVGKDNNLKYLFSKVATEWHPTKNGELRPEEFTHGSQKLVWWLCPKGHSYDAIIKSRTRDNPTGCPFCSGHRVSNENNLKVLFPKVATEWHPTKNGDSRPEDFTSGSSKKVWWLCPKRHSYDTTIAHRTNNKPTGCPYCSNQSSSPELRILTELRFIFHDVKTRHKIDGVEIDVYVPKLNLAIEYDGFHFHQGKEQKDIEKNKFLELKIIKVIRVRRKPLTKISENDLIVENDDLSKSDLNRVFKKIYSFSDSDVKEKINEYFDSDHFLNETLFRKYLSYFPSPLPEKSLATNFPNLISEWDIDKNHPLTPHNFTSQSSKKVWWICPNGHSYDALIFSRTRDNPTGCPYCSGRRVSKENNLKYLFPKIASEWHPTKNGDFKPEEFTCGGHKKVWWLCPKGHEYDSVISSRTSKGKRGCPYCSGQRVGEDNNLKHLFPKVAAEWHPTKNGDSRPEDFTSGTKSKVWWLCPKGHSYDTNIASRTGKRQGGCPFCRGKRVGEDNNLKFLYPKIAAEWHPTKNGDSKPEGFFGRSHKKVWWLCHKGHDYDAVIASRTSKRPTGCPHCYRNSS